MHKMLRILLILFCTSLILNVSAQCPEDTNLTFETQSELEEFYNTYPSCVELSNIRLKTSDVDPITDLSPLRNIERVSGTFSAFNLTELENFNGMDNFRYCLTMSIANCLKLTSTSGMTAIDTIERRLRISGCPQLEEIVGFEKIKVISQDFTLEELPNLTSINSLSNLDSILYSLRIEKCNSLTDISPLNGLKVIGGSFSLIENEQLAIVEGFEQLTHIGGSFNVEYNPSLIQISGFNNVDTLNRDFNIKRNTTLKNIIGFNNAKGLDEFSIDNKSLEIIDGFRSTEYVDLNFRAYPELRIVDGFDNVKTAKYVYFIRNPKLEIIPILDNLETVDKGIELVDCPLVTTFEGMNNLREIDIDLEILDNPSLTTIPSFPKLESVIKIAIQRNDNISDIIGFDSLIQCNQITITKNPSIVNVPNFNELDYITSFYIVENEQLQNFPTFEKLKFASVSCRKNPLLETINSMHALESIHRLSIGDNDRLTSISGMNNITKAEVVEIYDNPLLISIPNFNSIDTFEHFISIADNTSLPSFEGFNNIDKIERITISNNAITSLDVLAKVPSAEIIIKDNPNLLSIRGFNQLDSTKLTIESNPSLKEIPSLSNLTKVSHLEIEDNTSLETLSIGSNVTKIRKLQITGNHALVSLDGFDNLTDANEIILDGTSITHIPSFPSLRNIGQSRLAYDGLYLNNMPSIQYIGGFEQVDTIIGWLEIQGNTNLKHVSGFNSLQHIHGDFNLNGNDSLSVIDTFPELTSIYKNYRVKGNNILKYLPPTPKLHTISQSTGYTDIAGDSLSSLESLSSLTSCGQFFIRNTNLRSLYGLHNVNPATTVMPTLQGNSRLSDCNYRMLCENMSSGCQFIMNNAEGCNSCEEFLCDPDIASGNLYYDANENQYFDHDESGFTDARIHVMPSDIYLIPRHDGLYSFKCEEDVEYIISLIHSDEYQLTTDTLIYHYTHIPGSDLSSALDFGLKFVEEKNSGEIYLSSKPTRCNTKVEFNLNYKNTGSGKVDGRIELTLDPDSELISASPSPDMESNIVVWDFKNLRPFEIENIEIDILMPNEQLTGETMQFEAKIITENGIEEQVIYTPQVLCSYDPNDKLVMPYDGTEENIIQKDQELTYTIRFQNDGNAEAIDVSIRDTISHKLDIRTMRVIDSSFPVITSISDRAVQFFFDAIWLPSSKVDSLGSQGHVTFKIYPIADIGEGETIPNKASIYFDFNAPIHTNTALSTIFTPTHTSEVEKAKKVNIYPNPASETIHISAVELITAIQVVDAKGVIVYEGNKSNIDTSEWSSGIYFVKTNTTNNTYINKISIIAFK